MATVGPTIPSDLPLTASTEEKGVRVTLALDRNPMPAGEETWATLMVQNILDEDVRWLHDGCSIPAGLWGDLGIRWHAGHLGTGLNGRYDFRRLALRLAGEEAGAIRIGFTEEQFIGQGSFGCADIGLVDMLAPGARLEQRVIWDGMAFRALGPPPPGEVTLTVWAGYYQPVSVPEDVPSGPAIEFEVPAWIVGDRDSAFLDPPQIIDLAISDPEFGTWLDQRDVGSGNEPRLWYDPDGDLWHVELLTYYEPEPGTIHGLVMDPRTGEIVERVDYLWDGEFDHHGW